MKRWNRKKKNDSFKLENCFVPADFIWPIKEETLIEQDHAECEKILKKSNVDAFNASYHDSVIKGKTDMVRRNIDVQQAVRRFVADQLERKRLVDQHKREKAMAFLSDFKEKMKGEEKDDEPSIK